LDFEWWIEDDVECWILDFGFLIFDLIQNLEFKIYHSKFGFLVPTRTAAFRLGMVD
jgi:hypothetical protein